MDLWQTRLGPDHSMSQPVSNSLAFPLRFSLRSARGYSKLVGTTDKGHPPYRSNEEAGVFARSKLLVLPSCAIPNLRQAELGPDPPANLDGATSLGNSSQPGREEFSMIRCLRD